VLSQRWPRDARYVRGSKEPLQRYGHSKLSKMAACRQLGFDVTGNSAIRSADPENPTLEPNMKCIVSPVAGRLKTREWTTWHQVAGVENAGVSDSGKWYYFRYINAAIRCWNWLKMWKRFYEIKVSIWSRLMKYIITTSVHINMWK